VDLLLANNDSFYIEKNEVRSFVKGRDKFDALLLAIKGAKHHIHMEYNIIRNDALGREIMAALTEKARQGVEVRLLYDALGNKIPPKGYQDLIAAGPGWKSFSAVHSLPWPATNSWRFSAP
jgi:cardiolipin synthase